MWSIRRAFVRQVNYTEVGKPKDLHSEPVQMCPKDITDYCKSDRFGSRRNKDNPS